MSEEGSPKTEMINPALLDGVSANFIVKGPSGVEKSYPMRQLAMTIGRSDQCDISVKDGSMSGKHAEISKINGEIRVRDLGSSNGIFLNGERVTDAELFDGDVIRMGQTSVRIDVVGGKKRPEGMSAKVLVALIVGFVVLAGAGIGLGLFLKKRAQHKADLKQVTTFIETARENQKSKVCQAVVDKIGDVARQMNGLGKVSCATPPKGDEAKKLVAGYKDLAATYNRIVLSLNDFSTRAAGETTALAGSADAIADAKLKDKVAEAQEAVEQRHAVTTSFISDWKKLQAATSSFAAQADAALVQGNKAICPNLEKGLTGVKTPTEVLQSCNKAFDKARLGVEDKLKELEELTGAGGEAAE